MEPPPEEEEEEEEDPLHTLLLGFSLVMLVALVGAGALTLPLLPAFGSTGTGGVPSSSLSEMVMTSGIGLGTIDVTVAEGATP